MSESAANRVDLDDSKVLAIHRSPGHLLIELDQLRNGRSKRISISATGLQEETAEYFVGLKVTAPHPNPELPLDYIEYAEQGPYHLELGGYIKNEPWYLWRITADQIEITESNDE